MQFNFNTTELVILIAFAISFFIQIFYYLFFYLRIAFYKVKDIKSDKQPAVSVIICAKNEEDNLTRFLPKILEQDYPNFELIVVNDRSIDDTENILNRFRNKYTNLYVTTIPPSNNTRHNKKLALSVGLKAAKNEYILLTDADCEPIDNKWISNMTSQFNDKTDIIIGYGGYAPVKGFLNKLIRYDTLTIAMQYLSFAMAKIPYMGVGRNMAYRKSFFQNSKGFTSHLNIASGDDDLFVNENATKRNVQVMINPRSFTQSIAETNYKDWIFQKKRHFCTGKYYKTKHKILLGLENFSRFSFYLTFIIALFLPAITLFALIGYAFRYILQSTVLYFTSKKLNEKGVFYLAILLDILIPIINLSAYLRKKKFCKNQ